MKGVKDIHWYNEQIQSIKKRKRNLKLIQDPNIVKKIKKDLEVEKRMAKRAEKQNVEKHIREEIQKYKSK